MAVTNTAAPTREDFAAMLDEAFSSGNLREGFACAEFTASRIEASLPMATSARGFF